MEGNSQHKPVFRWIANAWRGCLDLEWLQSPEALVPAIRALLQVQIERAWGFTLSSDSMEVEFISEGAWNRAYKVTLPPSLPVEPLEQASPTSQPYCRHLVFRLSAPVLASDKVRSEVATLRWVRQRTAIPVPRVFLYDASGRTFPGYEWILMDLMPGKPLDQVWDDLPLEATNALASTVAEWVHSLWSLPFDSIGSLYDDVDEASLPCTDTSRPVAVRVMNLDGIDTAGDLKKRDPQLGPVCSTAYMGDWRPEYRVARGPFRDMRQFCLSCVDIARRELQDVRQQTRARIEHLTTSLYYEDSEYLIQRRPSSDRHTKNIKRKMEKETSADRRERHQQIDQHKTELAQIVEDLSSTTHLDGSFAAKLLDAFYDDKSPRESEPVDLVTKVVRASAEPNVPQPHGLVSLHSASVDHEEWGRYTTALDQFASLVQTLVPDRPLPPRCSVLHHWDISDRNVLVDPSTGQPTALLDWEHIFAVPLLSLIEPESTEPGSDSGSESSNGTNSSRDTRPPTGPAEYFPYPRLMSFNRLNDWNIEYSYCCKKPSRGWIPDSTDTTTITHMEKVWAIQAMRVAYKTRLDELASGSSFGVESLRRGMETVAKPPEETPNHSPGQKSDDEQPKPQRYRHYGHHCDSNKPGTVEPSPCLSDRDLLVRDIIDEVQQFKISFIDVHQLVQRATGLGYKVQDDEAEAEEEGNEGENVNSGC